jgi:hypothetical protein
MQADAAPRRRFILTLGLAERIREVTKGPIGGVQRHTLGDPWGGSLPHRHRASAERLDLQDAWAAWDTPHDLLAATLGRASPGHGRAWRAQAGKPADEAPPVGLGHAGWHTKASLASSAAWAWTPGQAPLSAAGVSPATRARAALQPDAAWGRTCQRRGRVRPPARSLAGAPPAARAPRWLRVARPRRRAPRRSCPPGAATRGADRQPRGHWAARLTSGRGTAAVAGRAGVAG